MTKKPENREPGVDIAINAAGGLRPLARLLGIKSPSISGWPRVPAERVLEIERLTANSKFGQATRYAMRPDLYPVAARDIQDPHKLGFMKDLLSARSIEFRRIQKKIERAK